MTRASRHRTAPARTDLSNQAGAAIPHLIRAGEFATDGRIDSGGTAARRSPPARPPARLSSVVQDERHAQVHAVLGDLAVVDDHLLAFDPGPLDVLQVLVARSTPFSTASSKLRVDEAMISVTRATLMGISFCGMAPRKRDAPLQG